MNREAFKYAPYYCEENVWHLCQEKEFRPYDRNVVIISNENHSCALWHQRAGIAPGEPIFWDYHVVLLYKNNGWKVYDLDTDLPTPTPFADYLMETFKEGAVPEQYRSMFRVIDADEFVKVFSSDRSHMLSADGRWKVEPPSWPAIVRNGESNLMELIDMRNKSIGQLMDLFQFEVCFTME